MALLDVGDKNMFDGFIQWRKEAAGHISEDMTGLVHFVLFGYFSENKEIHNTWAVCREDECRRCKMYQADRCHAFVKSKYAQNPNRMREIMKNNYAKSDYQFYQQVVNKSVDRRQLTELMLIVGPYRFELWKEAMHDRAVTSSRRHNKVNKDDQITVLKDKDPKYYSMDYIQENDFWSMYKETQLEGDLLCSILSDF